MCPLLLSVSAFRILWLRLGVVANYGLLGPVPIMAVHNMIRIQGKLALVDRAAIGKKGN